jgi:hypothetical protein
MSNTASSLFITPHTKIILAAFPPDFMGLFIPSSHYIPNRKKINKNKETFHRCFLPRFGSIGQEVSEEKI